jgi:hypothetical protein
MSFPTDPLMFFRQVFSLAEQKQFVGPWGYTIFGSPRGFLGLTGHVGFAYAPPGPLPGVPLPAESFLAMTFLRAEEAAIVQQIGVYRILTQLGRVNRYYPYPSWSDRDRAPVTDPAAFETSLLSKVGRVVSLRGVHVRMQFSAMPEVVAGTRDRDVANLGEPVEVWFSRGQGPELTTVLRSFGESGSFVLRTDPDPHADARLVWQPGQMSAQTIAPEGSPAGLVTGGFLMVVFGPSLVDGARVLEDGFAVTLGAEAWQRVLRAVSTGESADVAAHEPGMKPFAVRWIGDNSATR